MIAEDVVYPEGHFIRLWMGIGMAIFSGLGIPLSITTGNYGFIGIGPAIGVAFGLSIGQSIENEYKQEGKIKSLSESEKNKRKSLKLVGIVLLSLGLLGFLMLFLILRW